MAEDDLRGALREGPARLSPQEVAASQRRRMLAAMVAAAAEKGYARVAVTDVVGRARVSRATFYEHFTDKDDCFLAAFQACVDRLVGELRERTVETLAPPARLRGLLEGYLGALASYPEGAQVCLVEMHAAGVEAARHRHRIQLDFAAMLRAVHAAFEAAGEPVRPLTGFDFEALVGAISTLATSRVATGEATALPALATALEGFVLTHFGVDAAS